MKQTPKAAYHQERITDTLEHGFYEHNFPQCCLARLHMDNQQEPLDERQRQSSEGIPPRCGKPFGRQLLMPESSWHCQAPLLR